MQNKLIACLLMATLALTLLFEQNAAAMPQAAQPSGGLSQPDLEELLGPIALYPDELLANVLASAVYPQELLAAQAYLDKGGDATKISDQDWEDSVKDVAAIPDLLKFLTDNMEWTEAVGQAYIVQSADVMKAVQALRTKAYDNGALKSGEQMTVVKDGPTIIIQPADPQVIYVPQYNPQVVYVQSAPSSGDVVAAGLIGFGVGVAVGAIWNNNYNCNWHGGYVGWGWHGGGHYGGHNDIDIDIDRNVNVGDVNIGSGNTIQGGDRTNIKGGDRNTANVGREGTKWEPNSKKVDQNAIKNGGAKQLDGYKGVANNKSMQESRVPRTTTANSGRQSPAAVTRDQRPTASQGAVKQRTPTAGAPSARPATPNTRNTPRPSTGNVPTPKTQAPRQSSPAAKQAPAKSKPSGFSPDRGSTKSTQRGSSSRKSSSSNRSSGGRSGGGSRGGGRRG